jgi:hypothetical protein
MSDMTSSPKITAAVLVDDLKSVFSNRLRAIVAYGPHLDGDSEAPLACLALVSSLSLSDLEACARLSSRWHRAQLATPLVLPEEEFRRSLDAFPLEYGEIIRAHADVYGDDPFATTSIATEDLRRACETQVKSHLVHLRESFIESRGGPAEVAALVRTAAPAFAALLRNVARLSDVHTRDRQEATRHGARIAGIGDGVVTAVLALERRSGTPMADPAGIFPEYLAAVEQLARTVDTWKS